MTTVLGLDWLVSQVLETKPIRDFTDYKAVATQIKKLQSRLGIDLPDARSRLEDLESFKLQPFSYSLTDLSLIKTAFGDVWNGPLTTILTKFSPYAGLIAKRIHDKTLSLDHQQWFQLRERKRQDPYEGKATQEYRQFIGRIATRANSPISEQTFEAAASKLDGFKSQNLAFNVAFQRALFLAFLEYAKLSSPDVSELVEEVADDNFPDFGDLDAPDDVEEIDDSAEAEFASPIPDTKRAVLKRQYVERATEFVQQLNRVVEAFPGFLELDGAYTAADGSNREFWSGTLLRKPEDTIDFTQAASKRARDLIFLASAIVLYDDSRDPNATSDFDAFWEECTQEPDLTVTDSIGRAIYRFTSGEGSAAGRAIRGRGEDYDTEMAADEAFDRLSFLWNELGL